MSTRSKVKYMYVHSMYVYVLYFYTMACLLTGHEANTE